jgi:hypothetical protein
MTWKAFDINMAVVVDEFGKTRMMSKTIPPGKYVPGAPITFSATLEGKEDYFGEQVLLDLRVPEYESARAAVSLVRNASFDLDPSIPESDDLNANPKFVYSTDPVAAPEALVADIRRTEVLEYPKVAGQLLVEALTKMFDTLVTDGALNEGMGIQVRIGYDDRLLRKVAGGSAGGESALTVEPYPAYLMPVWYGGDVKNWITDHLKTTVNSFLRDMNPKLEEAAITFEVLLIARSNPSKPEPVAPTLHLATVNLTKLEPQ